MSWSFLSTDMQQTLLPFVKGKRIWDLGAGSDLKVAIMLRCLGATVIAFDKEVMHRRDEASDIQTHQCRFQDIEGLHLPLPDVTVVSWPVNNYNCDALIPLLTQIPVVVYLGKNYDGTACGTLGLFDLLRKRELLAHVPHRANSLLVVGAHLEGRKRALTPEEVAVWYGRDLTVMTWDQVQEMAASLQTKEG